MQEKETRYASIPATFDETKHYIEQLPAVNMGEHMWIDVVIKDLVLTDTSIEQHASIENTKLYIPEPTIDERLLLVEQVLTDLKAKIDNYIAEKGLDTRIGELPLP